MYTVKYLNYLSSSISLTSVWNKNDLDNGIKTHKIQTFFKGIKNNSFIQQTISESVLI